MKIWLVCLTVLALAMPAYALSYEEGSDAPTRTLEDYIKDYVDVPKGATDWKVFGSTKEIDIKTRDKNGFDYEYYRPLFSKEVMDLEGKEIIIKGFMFPLDETEKQKLFLFGPFPVSCPFQYHTGPSLVLEVHADKDPIKFSYDPIVIQGRLELVPKDKENSTFYRLLDAHQVKS